MGAISEGGCKEEAAWCLVVFRKREAKQIIFCCRVAGIGEGMFLGAQKIKSEETRGRVVS